MAIKVQCPGCNKVFSAQDSYHYKTMKCPNCGTKFRVTIPADLRPTPSGETPVLQLEPLEKEQREKTEQLRKHQEEKAKWRERCTICGNPIDPLDFKYSRAVMSINKAYHVACLRRQESAKSALRAKAPVPSHKYEPPRYDHDDDQSSLKWVAIAIIIAALIIIGGYIAYTEYNKYWAKNAIEKLFDPGKR